MPPRPNRPTTRRRQANPAAPGPPDVYKRGLPEPHEPLIPRLHTPLPLNLSLSSLVARMDPFQEFRAQVSTSVSHDSFAEFRTQPRSAHTDAFAEFRSSSSGGLDAYPEFRTRNQHAPREDSFTEFRMKTTSGRDEFSEFRAPSTSGKTRQLLRRILHLAPAPAEETPQIEDEPQHEELRVTLPLPGARIGDVQVQLHATDLVVENALTHSTRTISLPSAVLPDATAALKNGKLSITLHKCATPLDSATHPIFVH